MPGRPEVRFEPYGPCLFLIVNLLRRFVANVAGDRQPHDAVSRMEVRRLDPKDVANRPYQELLARLREAFPAPVSDRMHDAYFVFSILRALDQLDDLKSEVPLLGRPRTLDYAAAERAELAEEGRSAEDVGTPAGRSTGGHADLGASADADQRRAAAVHPQRHRVAAAGHLQPEPGFGRHVVRPDADRGGGHGDGVAARRLRPGAGGRRFHVRRDRDRALRREAGHREGVPGRHGQRRAGGRRHPGVRAEPLLPPERRRLARARREERRGGADPPGE